MSLSSVARAAHEQVRRPWGLIAACCLGILLTVLLPSDPAAHHDRPASESAFIHAVENQGRFINTIVQVALPIIRRDAIGIMQNIYLGLGSTAITHGLKRPGGHRRHPAGRATQWRASQYAVGTCVDGLLRGLFRGPAVWLVASLVSGADHLADHGHPRGAGCPHAIGGNRRRPGRHRRRGPFYWA